MRMKPFVIALALLVPIACTGRKAAWTQDSNTNTPTDAAATAQASGAVADGDAKWAERGSADNVKAAISAWEKGIEADPKNPELLVKLTRANYFLADAYLRDNDAEYLKAMDKGVKWGERAIMAVSPKFEEIMRGKKGKLPEAVKAVDKVGVPAMYWYASSLGKWAKRKGFAVLVGQKDNVKATMDRCLELDPTYYHGGPHRYFGAFYAIAPGFAGGDLEKSKIHFKKSLEIEPKFFGTKVLWAAELAVKEQDEETFDRLISEILAAPDGEIPGVAAELKVEKEKATELKANKADLF